MRFFRLLLRFVGGLLGIIAEPEVERLVQPHLERCRRVEDVRMFRLDRIAQIEVLAAAAEPPPQARSRDLSAGLFQPSPTDLLATVELDPSARWVAEYYPCESVTELGSGRMRVTLRVSDPAWLRRLVLRLGGAARLVSPAEDAAAIRAAAAEALKAYDTA